MPKEVMVKAINARGMRCFLLPGDPPGEIYAAPQHAQSELIA